MPELPAARRARFIEHSASRVRRAGLTRTRAHQRLLRKGRRDIRRPAGAANWVMGDLAGLPEGRGQGNRRSPVSAENLGRLVALIAQGKISGKLAKRFFRKCSPS
jgi:aspartyl-tRNA(Asn)/glutamyl-tRNA(Gln) amidotransferase subunit B